MLVYDGNGIVTEFNYNGANVKIYKNKDFFYCAINGIKVDSIMSINVFTVEQQAMSRIDWTKSDKLNNTINRWDVG